MILPYPATGVIPKVHESAFIEQSAQVIGDAEIGPESSVWFNAVIRGDVNFIRIGARTNIQDLCTVHVTLNKFPTFIGDDVTVGHRAVIHGARIGNHCLIGMGSIVLDGAEIADHCLIGAGALVPPGMKVPPRSLVVGVPGKVVRQLTDEDVERNLNQAREYIRLSREYMKGSAE